MSFWYFYMQAVDAQTRWISFGLTLDRGHNHCFHEEKDQQVDYRVSASILTVPSFKYFGSLA